MSDNKTPKRIAFRIDRSSVAKAYIPLIQEAVQRKIPVFMLCGPDPHNSWPHNKAYRPIRENLNFPNIEKITLVDFEDTTDMEQKVYQHQITDLVTVHFREGTFGGILPRLRKKGVKVYGVQWAGDHMTIKPSLLNQIDYIFVFSKEMAKMYFRAYKLKKEAKLRQKFIAVGNPLLDYTSQLKSPLEIKKKYNIPTDSKVVLLMSLNLVNSWGKWVFGAKNKINLLLNFRHHGNLNYLFNALFNNSYASILKKIKKWCDGEGASLVVKTRPKHREPEYLRNLGGIMLSDSLDWYPPMSLELISIADLVIGFNSTSVLEAAFLKKPNISIDIERESSIPEYVQVSYFTEDGVHEHPGVSSWVSYKKINEFLENKKISDFQENPAERDAYVKKFLGFDDSQSARRIIDFILSSN